MKRKSTSRETGMRGERIAANYLRLHGYTVKERNYRAGRYEIDVIAANFRTIAFVEVKTRTYTPEEAETAPPPGMAVNAEKREFTRRAARQYLFEHPTKKRPRMDVIEIWLAPSVNGKKPKILRIHHIPGAY